MPMFNHHLGFRSISPSSGMTTGGTSVVIAGHDFIEGDCGQVWLNPGPALRSTPKPRSRQRRRPRRRLEQWTPASRLPAGTTASSPADRFTYTAPPVPQPLPAKVSCTVPKLKGEKLKAAKQALLKAQCKLRQGSRAKRAARRR